MSAATLTVNVFPDGRLNTTNASMYLGLSQKTLAMMRTNGRGPKFIKRGRVFYYVGDLDEWLNAEGKVTTTAECRLKKADTPHQSCS